VVESWISEGNTREPHPKFQAPIAALEQPPAFPPASLPYPFTMSWQVTRRLKVIRIQRGQPICMITPIRRGEIETVDPEIRNIESDPELLRSFNVWSASRRIKVQESAPRPSGAPSAKPQGHYIRGEGHL